MTSNFDFQPILEGPRITVRPIATADWHDMFAAAADPGIWEQHPVPDRYTETSFRQYFDDAIDSGSAFAFVDRLSGEIIGSSRYHGLDPVKSEVEIGWTFLARAYWGGSYNAEIKQLLLDHAYLYVDTVVFWIGEANMRSRKATEKIGGELRDGIHFKEMSGDLPYVVYEISRSRGSDNDS
jgi:RimJ/RimL family protein N-acetyltransferase